MGIQKSVGRNKKSKRPATAVAVKRAETVRRAGKDLARPRPQGMR
jgi:hypothetical protein